MSSARSRGLAGAGACLLAVALLVAACSSTPPSHMHAASSVTASTGGSSSVPSASGLPPIRHVFVIMLENEGYDATFENPANDPYLGGTLVKEGALLDDYYAVGHFSLDNYIALVSGQPPNSDTEADCVGGLDDFPQGDTQESWDGATGIQEGTGCVYPAGVQTLAGQMSAKGYSWKGYMEDMGNDPTRDGAPESVCGHPPLDNGPDPTVVAVPGDGYTTRHDPFIYFHSIIDNASYCDEHVVPLGSPSGAMPPSDTVGATGLATDLRSVSTTPNFSYITPNMCDDGHDYPCVNETSPGPSEFADIDDFLETWVPLITSSPAFREDGLLEITFDEGDTTDTTSCCNEQAGPVGVPAGQSATQGGGRMGTVLISPFIKPGQVISTPFNHYSSLATFEDLFGLPRLGDSQTVTSTFDRGVFDTAH